MKLRVLTERENETKKMEVGFANLIEEVGEDNILDTAFSASGYYAHIAVTYKLPGGKQAPAKKKVTKKAGTSGKAKVK